MQGWNAIAGARRTVAFHPRHADLHTYVAEAALHELARIVEDFGDFGAFGVRVAIHGLPAFPSQHFVDRHAGLAPLDIPQRLIDTTDCVIQHRPVAPVGTVVTCLPRVFDAIRRF